MGADEGVVGCAAVGGAGVGVGMERGDLDEE